MRQRERLLFPGIILLGLGVLLFFISEQIRVQIKLMPFSMILVVVLVFGVILFSVGLFSFMGDRLPARVGLLLIFFGSIILVWVGQVTWHDITVWNKDISLILFGSRTGEHISLGIGMKVIHYFLIGLALLFPGLAIFLRRRLRKCPHHFGYLENLPNTQAVPQECITCQKMIECRNISSFT